MHLRIVMSSVALLLAIALGSPAAIRAVPRQTSLYPDPVLTPGDFYPDVTASDVCTPGYARAARHVTKAERAAVFAAYGVPDDPRLYTLDHFIPLNLGGTNETINLWPEPVTAPGAHEKDRVEDFLHAEVCAGHMDLAAAREAIRTDWYAVYLAITGQQPAAEQ
jgi:hypothetical protein